MRSERSMYFRNKPASNDKPSWLEGREIGRVTASFFPYGSILLAACSVNQYPLENSSILDSGTTIHILQQPCTHQEYSSSKSRRLCMGRDKAFPGACRNAVSIFWRETHSPVLTSLERNLTVRRPFLSNLAITRLTSRPSFHPSKPASKACDRAETTDEKAVFLGGYTCMVMSNLKNPTWSRSEWRGSKY